MNKTQYQLSKVPQLDDAALAQFTEDVAERMVDVEEDDLSAVTHISEMQAELNEVRQERGKFLGFSTGYKTLDDKLGGIEGGSVVLIGGETSNGKSAMATNIAINIGLTMNNVLYLTLEMTRKQMLDRIDKMSESRTLEIDMAIQRHFNITYRNLEAIVDRSILEHGTQVVVIDYLQYLGRGMDEKEVAIMSKKIKSLALTRHIAFIVIVSLRKSSSDPRNKRKWHEIEIEDMMGTAAIGYDADSAMIVSRKDTNNEYQPDSVFVKVLKTRNNYYDYNNRFVALKWLSNMKIVDDFTLDVRERMKRDSNFTPDTDGFVEVEG